MMVSMSDEVVEHAEWISAAIPMTEVVIRDGRNKISELRVSLAIRDAYGLKET